MKTRKLQEFFYTMKVCNIRFFAWFLPFPLLVYVMQQFGSQEKFNGKYVNAVRLGNSGLWFIYSQEIQNAIRNNMDRNRRFEREDEEEKIKEAYFNLNKLARDELK